MFSPQIAEFVRRAESSEGLNLHQLPLHTLLKIETQDHSYHMLVLEPKEGRGILEADHPRLREPQTFYLQGATGGGSVVKLGCIIVGLHLRMNLASGGLLVTSRVKSVRVVEDAVRRQKLSASAEAAEKPEAFSPEEFDRAVRALLDQKFPAEYRGEVQQFVGQFCPEGKGIMLGILDRAREAGKLDEALRLLGEDFKEHWDYRPPHVRGSFITEQDVYYVQRAYQRLGIPLPGPS